MKWEIFCGSSIEFCLDLLTKFSNWSDQDIADLTKTKIKFIAELRIALLSEKNEKIVETARVLFDKLPAYQAKDFVAIDQIILDVLAKE